MSMRRYHYLSAILLLLLAAQNLYAAGSERFLERLSSETRDGNMVITVHFMQTLQYLSHTPENNAERVSVRFRRSGPVAANVINAALGEGVRRLKPAPGQIPRLLSIVATGNLDMDPGLLIKFDQPRSFELRPGPDARSISIVLSTAAEPGSAAPSTEAVEAEAPPTPEFSGDTPEDRHLQNLFVDARNAAGEGNYRRATAIYDKIIATAAEPYTREAIRALGMLRAENRQAAQARAQFELYLERYPESAAAADVQRRLDTLLAQQKKAGPAGDVADSGAQTWNYFGSFDQFYLYDGGKFGDGDHEDYRSSLLSSANLSWQGRAGSIDVSGRFSGSYDYSFLNDRDSPTRVSYLYLDLAGQKQKHQARLGRQRLSGSGVLGYFDGLHYQYKLNDSYSLRYAGGAPVRSTREGVDSDRLFNALAVDLHGLDNDWFISLYGLEQTYDGDTDRRALGTEARYFGDQYSLYSLLDYDFYFDELNIFHLFGNWRWSPETVASMTLEYRRSPSLSLSNALQGQFTDSLDDLQDNFTDTQLEEMAQNRSLIYKSVYLSLTHALNEQWQLLLDGGMYRLESDDDAADTLGEAYESDDWYVYTQLMGNSLFKQGDLYSAGVRYTDSDRMSVTSLLLRARVPVQERWRLTPRLRFDWRDKDDGGDQWRITPSLFGTYRLNKKTSLEFDLGMHYGEVEDVQGGGDLDERYYYFSLGYRYDF